MRRRSRVAPINVRDHHGAPKQQRSMGDDMAVENDLAELKGIGPKHAAMLKEIGVDSIKELRHRNAAKLKEMIESRHGKVVGLSEKTVQGWIDGAKAHDEK
jgi:predicted flap endonuclease-1-like 5' DNA nuclease